MPKYKIYRVMDFISMVGEEAVKDLFSDFSCEYKEGLNNNEVELFLKKNSVEFSKRKMSITYLVLDELDQVTGYFTLTHKPIVVKNEKLSKTSKKRLLRHAKYDSAIDAYSVSAYVVEVLFLSTRQKDKHIKLHANCPLNCHCAVRKILRTVTCQIVGYMHFSRLRSLNHK